MPSIIKPHKEIFIVS